MRASSASTRAPITPGPQRAPTPFRAGPPGQPITLGSAAGAQPRRSGLDRARRVTDENRTRSTGITTRFAHLRIQPPCVKAPLSSLRPPPPYDDRHPLGLRRRSNRDARQRPPGVFSRRWAFACPLRPLHGNPHKPCAPGVISYVGPKLTGSSLHVAPVGIEPTYPAFQTGAFTRLA